MYAGGVGVHRPGSAVTEKDFWVCWVVKKLFADPVLKEHIVFPEINFDKVDEVLGMDIIICTTAKTDDEAKALLAAFRFPFKN